MDLTGNAAGSANACGPSGAVGEVRSLLVFQLGPRAFALDIQDVKQVIPMMKLTPLPKAEPVFEGIANIHGQFIPVINTRRCLGLEDAQPNLYTPIILIKTGAQFMGLIVDQVTGVASLRVEQVIHPRTILPESVKSLNLISGIVYLSGQMVMLLDPRLLLDEIQGRLMMEALQSLNEAGALETEQPKIAGENGEGSETTDKKKAYREQNGLREPLAQLLADLAEGCQPAGGQPGIEPMTDPLEG